MTFSFDFEPVSLQSSPEKRKFIKHEIKKITSTLKYLLSGDVKVEIRWLTHEQVRYENANAPDMDNIIKPILDGLTGPKGILIDDCQVQTVSSHWIDWDRKEHQINITIQYIPDDYVSKNNLVFVTFGNNLYVPFDTGLKWQEKEKLLEHLSKTMNLRNKILLETGDYYQANMFMGIQRVFHKSRISENFQYLEISEFRAQIEIEKQNE